MMKKNSLHLHVLWITQQLQKLKRAKIQKEKHSAKDPIQNEIQQETIPQGLSEILVNQYMGKIWKPENPILKWRQIIF